MLTKLSHCAVCNKEIQIPSEIPDVLAFCCIGCAVAMQMFMEGFGCKQCGSDEYVTREGRAYCANCMAPISLH
jgi:hypothetical protein